MSDSESASHFAVVAREPAAWLWQATGLRDAAALVYEELDKAIPKKGWRAHTSRRDQLRLIGPFMLLSSLAIENILKGVLIQRDPTYATNDGLSKEWPGHALDVMADKVACPLSGEELDLLQRLKRFVVWGGRYPISKKAADFAVRNFRPTDRAAIDELFARIVAIMESEKAGTQK